MKKLSDIWERLFHKPRKGDLVCQKREDESIDYSYSTDNNLLALDTYDQVRRSTVLDMKEATCISLTRLNIQKYRKLDFMLDDNICPVNYLSCRLWAICSTTFWYAIEYCNNFYAFDIREISEKMHIPVEYNSETVEMVCLHRHDWMAEFVKRMNDSKYFIDIQQSIIKGFSNYK